MNEDKTENMCFNQRPIFTLNGGSLKLVDTCTYLSSSVSSAENDVSICLAKAWTAIDWLSIVWKSDLSDKSKQDFFQAVVVSILLYRCTTNVLRKMYWENVLRKSFTETTQECYDL